MLVNVVLNQSAIAEWEGAKHQQTFFHNNNEGNDFDLRDNQSIFINVNLIYDENKWILI